MNFDKKIHIVIIDDDLEILNLFRFKIREDISSNKVDLTTFSSPLKGLSFLMRNGEDIDILIIDINMPYLTGFNILERINNHESCQHIKKYVLSKELLWDNDKYLSSFLAGTFVKPMDIDLIKKTIFDDQFAA